MLNRRSETGEGRNEKLGVMLIMSTMMKAVKAKEGNCESNSVLFGSTCIGNYVVERGARRLSADSYHCVLTLLAGIGGLMNLVSANFKYRAASE